MSSAFVKEFSCVDCSRRFRPTCTMLTFCYLQVEALDPEADDYIVMDRTSLELAWREQQPVNEEEQQTEESSQFDPLLPPLHHLLVADADAAASTAGAADGEAIEGVKEGGLEIRSSGFNRDQITIVAHLDRSNPLTEARWVKTGEIEAWILSLAIANGQDPKKDSLSAWKGKITVSDPDPVRSFDLNCFARS